MAVRLVVVYTSCCPEFLQGQSSPFLHVETVDVIDDVEMTVCVVEVVVVRVV
jgi:hypothetical protein